MSDRYDWREIINLRGLLVLARFVAFSVLVMIPLAVVTRIWPYTVASEIAAFAALVVYAWLAGTVILAQMRQLSGELYDVFGPKRASESRPRSVNRSEDAKPTREDMDQLLLEWAENVFDRKSTYSIPSEIRDALNQLYATASAGLEDRERYDLLRRAINEYDVDGCTPKCDKLGHAEDCRSGDPRAIIENQQRRIDELQAGARGVRPSPSDEGPRT